ncbi:MAG: hypothetical protein AABW92_00820 [Nanoarchaeota archaeon]
MTKTPTSEKSQSASPRETATQKKTQWSVEYKRSLVRDYGQKVQFSHTFDPLVVYSDGQYMGGFGNVIVGFVPLTILKRIIEQHGKKSGIFPNEFSFTTEAYKAYLQRETQTFSKDNAGLNFRVGQALVIYSKYDPSHKYHCDTVITKVTELKD